MLAWARAHWRGLAVCVAMLGSFAAGWLAHRPPPAPAVHLDQQAHVEAQRTATVDTTTHEGPNRVVHLDFDPDPRAAATPRAPVVVPGLGPVQVPAGERLESVTVEEDGASETDTHAAEQEHQVADVRTVLQVTPTPPLPRWSVGLGIDDALSARALRLSCGLRVAGPVWLDAAVVPARRELSVGAHIEF